MSNWRPEGDGPHRPRDQDCERIYGTKDERRRNTHRNADEGDEDAAGLRSEAYERKCCQQPKGE